MSAAAADEGLRALIGPLAGELGDTFPTRLAAFRNTAPGPFVAPEDEAIRFCRHVAEVAHHDQDRRTADFARLAEGLLWQQWTHPEDFEGATAAGGPDPASATPAVPAATALQEPEAHAPVRSGFLHLKRFRYLPPGYEDAPITGDGVYFLLFFKVPGKVGDHWPVTRFVAKLVEDCDGDRTVAELSRDYGERTGRVEELRALVHETLQLLADSGLIRFVRPTPR